MTKKQAGEVLSKLTDGVVTAVPTTEADAQKLLESMKTAAAKKVGDVLTKLTGVNLKIPTSWTERDAQNLFDSLKAAAAKKVGEVLAELTGGMITKVPTSKREAREMLDSMKAGAAKKAGEVMARLTNGIITKIPTSWTEEEIRKMLDSMISNLMDKAGEELSKMTGEEDALQEQNTVKVDSSAALITDLVTMPTFKMNICGGLDVQILGLYGSVSAFAKVINPKAVLRNGAETAKRVLKGAGRAAGAAANAVGSAVSDAASAVANGLKSLWGRRLLAKEMEQEMESNWIKHSVEILKVGPYYKQLLKFVPGVCPNLGTWG